MATCCELSRDTFRMVFLYQRYNCLTDNILGHYIKLKADEKLISPVCSESVESLLQIYGFFLKMQIYSSMNSANAIFWADSERCSATATSSITETFTISTSSAPRHFARAEKNATSALSDTAKAKPGSGVNLFDPSYIWRIR